ncbi:hypothetical protein PIB30_069689 [Stylosanthes scabra]|uniref:Uncharacterized protein n=1 Tax=Stylosanthes scabra TaxID=79078 RepID=A0ABU6YNT7_9FABA|nr:hypothetical protein [Stylosanthes scabra]
MTINTNNFIEETRSNFKNQGESIRNSETQVSQLAKQLATRSPNTFPSDTEVLENNSKPKSDKDVEDNTVEDSPIKSTIEESTQAQPKSSSPSSLVKGKEKHIPFPQRFQKEAKDQQFSKFREIFKKL